MAGDINIENFKELSINLKSMVQKIGEENCRQLESDVKSNAQTILDKGYATGVYASGWTTEVTDEGAIMKNTGKHATLSHILENGHKSRGNGFVPPQPHIRPAYQKIKNQYINDLKNIDIKPEFK